MCQNHHCFIVPPHILEGLAKRGNLSCKRTLNDTYRILHKRNTILDNLLIRELTPAKGIVLFSIPKMNMSNGYFWLERKKIPTWKIEP